MKVNVYTHPREPRKGKPRPPLILAYTMYQGQGACVHEVADDTWHRAGQAAIKEHRETCLKSMLTNSPQAAGATEAVTSPPGGGRDDGAGSLSL